MHEQNSPWEPDEDERSSYEPGADPISDAVGSIGYLTPHTVGDCIETFPDSKITRFPERFDRFYWQPERVLIDLVQDSSPDMLAEERARKRVDFKAAWCAANGYLYLAIPLSDADNVQLLRELLDAARTPAAGAVRAGSTPSAPKQRTQRKGAIQRPKAAA